MRNKFVWFVAIVLFCGCVVTVGLLFSMDAEELDSYYARYNKHLQDNSQISVSVTVQKVGDMNKNPAPTPTPQEPNPVTPTPNPGGDPTLLGENELAVPFIRQGDPAWKSWARGNYDQRQSNLGKNGCIDCCYTMAAMFMGTCSEVTSVNNVNATCLTDAAHSLKHTVQAHHYTGKSFITGVYTSEHGFRTTGDIQPATIQDLLDNIKVRIDNKQPVVLHIKGLWSGASTGVNLHSTNNDHFLLAVGYNDEGIIVNDPGRRDGDHKLVVYGDMANIPIKGYRECK